jgi:hypothetical protein
MKTIEYEFNPKEKIYWVSLHQTAAEGKCSFCLGDGEFLRMSDNSKIKCHLCDGKGKINIGYDASYKVFTGIVNSVRIWIQDNITNISYNVCNLEDGWGRNLKDSELYGDITEATRACEKLNKESGIMGSRGTIGITGG